MMNLGLGEILLLFVLALIVFGPEKLPELGGALGRALYEFRRVSADVTGTLLGPNAPTGPTAPPAPLPSGRPCVACGAFSHTEHRFCTTCGADQETWISSGGDGPTTAESLPPFPSTIAGRDDGLTTSSGEAVELRPLTGTLAPQTSPADVAVAFAPEAPEQHGLAVTDAATVVASQPGQPQGPAPRCGDSGGSPTQPPT